MPSSSCQLAVSLAWCTAQSLCRCWAHRPSIHPHLALAEFDDSQVQFSPLGARKPGPSRWRTIDQLELIDAAGRPMWWLAWHPTAWPGFWAWSNQLRSHKKRASGGKKSLHWRWKINLWRKALQKVGYCSPILHDNAIFEWDGHKKNVALHCLVVLQIAVGQDIEILETRKGAQHVQRISESNVMISTSKTNNHKQTTINKNQQTSIKHHTIIWHWDVDIFFFWSLWDGDAPCGARPGPNALSAHDLSGWAWQRRPSRAKGWEMTVEMMRRYLCACKGNMFLDVPIVYIYILYIYVIIICVYFCWSKNQTTEVSN